MLQGAVAGLESKLDTILADDAEASAKHRAEEAARKAAEEKLKAEHSMQSRLQLILGLYADRGTRIIEDIIAEQAEWPATREAGEGCSQGSRVWQVKQSPVAGSPITLRKSSIVGRYGTIEHGLQGLGNGA